MHRTPLIGGITAGLLMLGAHAGVVTAQAAEPPTLVELCAATSVEQVDALLADVAATDLVEALAPLATLTVPQGTDDLVLDADVTIGEVRETLDCAPIVDPDPVDPTTPVVPTSPDPTLPITPTAPPAGDQDEPSTARTTATT